MTTLEKATQLIGRFEGFRSEPYQNPGDRPTIGYGSTFYENGQAVTLNDDPISQDRGIELLQFFVNRCLHRVQELCQLQLTDNQTVALTSFEYNTGSLGSSSMLKYINSGDFDMAAIEFPKWDHVGGQVNQGLLKRRNEEMALFQTPDEVQ